MTDPQLTLFESEISDTEREAIAADFLAQHADVAVAPDPLRPQPCICEHPLVFASELGDGNCGLCGRGVGS